MKTKTKPTLETPEPSSARGEFEIKLAHSAHDRRRAKQALEREHGLGAGGGRSPLQNAGLKSLRDAFGEVSEGRALLADPRVRLVNALVSAAPLHNNESTARVILEKGGDYLIGTKANTSKRLSGDRHRHRRPNAAMNRALTRNALLGIIPFEQDQPLAGFFESPLPAGSHQTHPQRPPNLMTLPAKRPECAAFRT